MTLPEAWLHPRRRLLDAHESVVLACLVAELVLALIIVWLIVDVPMLGAP